MCPPRLDVGSGSSTRATHPASWVTRSGAVTGVFPPVTSQALSGEEDLVRYFASLRGTAIRRQIWLFFLDEADQPIGPAMPTDDYPTDPSELVVFDGLGTLPAAELCGARFAMLMQEFGSAQVVVVWVRAGGRLLDSATREWSHAFGAAMRDGRDRQTSSITVGRPPTAFASRPSNRLSSMP